MIPLFLRTNLYVGTTPPGPPEINDAILFSLRGQSNAQGRASVNDMTEQEKNPLSDVYAYYGGGIVNKYIPGSLPGNPGQFGVEWKLSILLRDYYNKPVIIDKTAYGGTGLHEDFLQWNVIHPDKLWAASKVNLNNVIKYSKPLFLNAQNKFGIWFQGEADAGVQTYAETYEVNQIALFEDWRSHVDNQSYKIVDIKTNSAYGTFANTVRTAKQNIANVDSNVIIFDADNYPTNSGDIVHVSKEGFELLAQDIFDQIVALNIIQ